MSSRRFDNAEHAAQIFWRPLARRAGWEVGAAAQLLSVSVRYLERRCQEELGRTPRDWFQAERMATATRLLAAGESVKSVARELGYTLPANFSRDFKLHFGRRPRAFAPRHFLALPSVPPAADSERALE